MVGDQTPPRLTVRLLGSVEVILDGKRLSAFNAPRLQKFLALITLRKGPQHRSRLAFQLWPDSGESQARTNLRKLLHQMRNALPDMAEFVAIESEIVRWLDSGSSQVDVLMFRGAIAAGDFELAARLYAGDLLPACYDDWILEERADLCEEARRVFTQLTERAVAGEDHLSAIRNAQRIIDLEPCDEAAVEVQMKAHLALGDRAAALRAYHRCVEALDRELGVAPGESIKALYQNVKTVVIQPQGAEADLLPVAESPFVGREREWSQLLELWDQVGRRGAHLLLLTGESGIGKSRLAVELGRHVRDRGAKVAAARAYEAAGRLPWGPVVELLRSDSLRSHIDTLEPIWRAELARLLPELTDVTGHADENRFRDPIQRHRLFDAVARALVMGDRSQLLIVDDLQWCDAETIELIGFLVRTGQSAPVLVAGTVRSDEVGAGHPLEALVGALERDQAVTQIVLERFDKATTAVLAARLRAGKAIEPALATRLWSETEGIPLFVIEALRAGISDKDGKPVLTPTMRFVLDARLSQLTDGARRVTEVAAVIGRSFSVELLASASGIDSHELVGHVDELWQRRIVRDQGIRYDFSHDKLRAVALESISPARRRQLHRAVAEALEVEHGDDVAAISPQLASHYEQAGMLEPAIEAYRVAGRRAVGVSALTEAVTLFRRALALMAELPASHGRDALELDIRVALGSPLAALEGYGAGSVHQLYERALALCRKVGRTVDPPIYRGLGLARLQGCRFDDCEKLAQALLDHERRDPVTRTEGRYLLGVSAFWRGDLARARRYLEAAIESFDPAHLDEHLALYAQDPKAICQVRLALVELWQGDPGHADEVARLALERAVTLDHLMTQGYVITYAAFHAAESENLPRLGELLEEADRVWQRLSERYLLVILETLRAWKKLREGSLAEADRIVQCVSRLRAEGETLHLTYALLLLGRARALTGEIHEGRAALREGLSYAERWDQRYLEAELWRVDGELAYLSGTASDAESSLRKAVDVAEAQGARWLQLRALHALAARFPDPSLSERLERLLGAIPSGREWPALRAARAFLQDSD